MKTLTKMQGFISFILSGIYLIGFLEFINILIGSGSNLLVALGTLLVLPIWGGLFVLILMVLKKITPKDTKARLGK